MKSLRHRHADAASSPNSKSQKKSSSRLRRKSTSNRNVSSTTTGLQYFIIFVMCSIALAYTIALSRVTFNSAGDQNHVRTGERAASPREIQKQAAENARKLHDDQKQNQRRRGKRKQAEKAQAPQDYPKHVSKPWRKLLKEVKKHKEKHPVVEKGKRSDSNIFKPYNKKNQVQLGPKRDKKGAIVYNPITKFKKEDLPSMGFDKKQIDELTGISRDKAIDGRERLVEILSEAGILDVDPEVIAVLPKWETVEELYGSKPVVLGLENCKKFRTQFDPVDASIGTAGMFNTGTNPLAMYISNNCKLPRNKNDKAGGTRWQVPWGKHAPASRKWTNTAGHDHKVNKTNVMPIVVVRDPYSWMQSMCKHNYEARWPHSIFCPNLAKPELLPNGKPDIVPIKVKYNPPANYTSLAHYWAQWYKEYLEADYPRLIVRFEDIQFHAKELVETVCQCAGAVPREDDALFRYVVDSAKWGAAHKSHTNMVSAMVKYGSEENRFKGMREVDWLVAKEVFTPEIMDLFGYKMPDHLK